MKKVVPRAALLAALCLLQPCAPRAQAAIDIPEPIHDFGTVVAGTQIETRFVIRNHGTGPATIRRVELSQPGIRVRIRPVLAAATEESLAVVWNTTGLSGAMEAEGTIQFVEAGLAPVIVVLKGTVKPRIELAPLPGVFASVFTGEGAQRSVTVTFNGDRPPVVSRLKTAAGVHFTAALTRLDVGGSYRIDVSVPPDLPAGRYTESVFLETSDPASAPVRIPINILVKNDVYANPGIVDFGIIQVKVVAAAPNLLELLTHTFLVKSRDRELAITSIECDVDALEIVRSPASGPSQTFRIDVRLRRDRLVPGPLTGSIRIGTTDPRFPRVDVPVSGHIE